jgi:hypothetical protein
MCALAPSQNPVLTAVFVLPINSQVTTSRFQLQLKPPYHPQQSTVGSVFKTHPQFHFLYCWHPRPAIISHHDQLMACADHSLLPSSSRRFSTVSRRTLKHLYPARCWWITPVIPDSQQAEIRRIVVPGHLGLVFETPSQPLTGHSGVRLLSQPHRRLRSGGLGFQASLGGKKSLQDPISTEKKLGVVAHLSSQQCWEG